LSFKSEIRDSTINALLEKASDRDFGKYLARLVLKKLRGFSNEPVSFDFPVTALVGPNGGGKTTILGAAACAYKEVPPKRFFAKSGKYDETMQDWAIEYELIDKEANKKDAIRRTASFRNRRWNREALDRDVLLFGVSRTVPVNERPELIRCASSSFSVPDGQTTDFTEPVKIAVSRILGKDIAGFKQLLVDSRGEVTLLTGQTKTGKGYSEFHFGAGESSIIRMVAQIEAANPQALVLIEEIENGLHPIATVRMVEYLVDVAERKRIQSIFTTHSNDALRPLPSKAIWVATQDRIFQGKLDIHSLRAITGQIEAGLVVFVEDAFAKLWFEAILRQAGNVAVDHIEVYGMEGDGTAVSTNKYHNANPSTKVPSLCFIDGDSKQVESVRDKVFRLPGQSPESYVFLETMAVWDLYGGKLAVALLQRFENADKVKSICDAVRLSNRDPHLLFAQIGEKLGLLPAQTVAAAFANIWAQAYGDKVADVLRPVEHFLPRERNSVQIQT
jgi:predicted ATPase